VKILKTIGLLWITTISLGTYAQELDANLQFRPRYEYRNGYKSLIKDSEDATSFVFQRSRLNLNFKQEKMKVKLGLQNIRTWGDAATTGNVYSVKNKFKLDFFYK
jgi:hypothetical protein